jgi:hypothetical protein
MGATVAETTTEEVASLLLRTGDRSAAEAYLFQRGWTAHEIARATSPDRERLISFAEGGEREKGLAYLAEFGIKGSAANSEWLSAEGGIFRRQHRIRWWLTPRFHSLLWIIVLTFVFTPPLLSLAEVLYHRFLG